MSSQYHPIENIELWKDKDINEKYIFTPPVRINFKYPCEYLILDAIHLKQIIKLWIKGEKEKLDGKYKDAIHLQVLIREAFKEEGIEL